MSRFYSVFLLHKYRWLFSWVGFCGKDNIIGGLFIFLCFYFSYFTSLTPVFQFLSGKTRMFLGNDVARFNYHSNEDSKQPTVKARVSSLGIVSRPAAGLPV